MRRNYGKYTFSVGALVTLALLGSEEGIAGKAYPQDNDFGMQSDRNIYVGLSYSPAWHRIENFSVGANDGSTAARFPSLRDAGPLMGNSFDWEVPNPQIRFSDNSVWSLKGNVGYRKKNTRIEVELGHQKFATKATVLDSRNELTQTVHLLAKDIANYVVNGNIDGLGRALADTDARHIVSFAQAVGRTSPIIDAKVCNKKVAWYEDRRPESMGSSGIWSCVDHAPAYGSGGVGKLNTLSKRFGKLEWHDKKQPDSSYLETNRGWPGTEEGKIDTAQGMARDLVMNLDQKERGVVAGLLTETISGGEVVEISEITATYLTVNACYDFGRMKVVPFFCVGVGPSFISVAQGQLSSKLSYKLKAGVSYKIARRLVLFADLFYNKVLGTEFYDIPVKHLATDESPSGRSANYATATLGISATGADIGMRFVF